MKTVVAAVVVAAVVVVAASSMALPAGAEGDAGASSRVIGRGDIVTTILRPLPRSVTSRAIDPSRCRWITFDDAQTEFLVAIAASVRGSAPTGAMVDELAALLDHEDDPDLLAHAEVQGQRCDGDIRAFRLQPRAEDGELAATRLGRQMITRLPAPVLVVSPPAATGVPVSQPVFVSVPPAHWQPVTAELSDGEVVAEVRARPIALRTYTGVHGAEFRTCPGPGRPFDPTLPTTPAVQAA